jgi:predicted TIM-barrel fold metal-dependent hydrolase
LKAIKSIAGMRDVDYTSMRTRTADRKVTLLPDPPARDVWFPFISVDDHALEPPTLFEGRVPAAMADRVPQLKYGYDGDSDIPYWQVDDEEIPIRTVNGSVGRPTDEWNLSPQDFGDFRPGVSDPTVRLRDMDVVGAWSSLCFPSVMWGFAGRRLAQMNDQAVGLASVKAYNDWVIEEWCAADTERLVPCQLPWLSDPLEAAKEIYRNAERGFKCVSFSENPAAVGFTSIHSGEWDPFFAACEETGTVLNLHVGSSGTVVYPDEKSPREVGVALFPVNSVTASVDWVYSRVPLRFPGLKIVLSEGGASWVPMVQERLVRANRVLESSAVWHADDPSPAEVFSRNFWFASLEDPSAFRNLDVIRADRVMVECDYPHSDSTWPDTQELLARDLGHLDIEDIYKICVGNACDVYGATPPPRIRFEESIRGREIADRF